MDYRTFLGAEDAQPLGAGQQISQTGDRLHQLDAIGLILEALVDLEERHHALGIERGGHGFAVNQAVHGAFEQDRGNNLVTGERARLDNPHAHRVDQAEHLVIGRPGIRIDAIALQRLGRGPARLVKRGDETFACGYFAGLFCMVHGFSSVPSSLPANPTAAARSARPAWPAHTYARRSL